jgi:ribulose 1,5-bisphosphate synthetase/thiazole synthase
VALWLVNDPVVQSAPVITTLSAHWVIQGTGDFNGDDGSFQSRRTHGPRLVEQLTGERALWQMHGTYLIAAATLGIFPLEWTVAAMGDFYGDGKPDIVGSNSITGKRALWMMKGTQFLSSWSLGIFPLG